MKKNRTKNFIVAVVCLFALSWSVQASNEDQLAAFKSFKDTPVFSIEVPTVVELPFDVDYIERRSFAVYENETKTFQPWFFNMEGFLKETAVAVESQVSSGSVFNLTDGKNDTYVEYALPETYKGVAEIKITGSKPVTSSALTILLDNHVARPTSIEIRTEDSGENSIVLARTRVIGQTVNFLETTAKIWVISLEYTQPLRITEIRLEQKGGVSTTKKGLRFLARPENTYRVYFNPDRSVSIATGESSDLSDDEEVLRLGSAETFNNSIYTKSDVDVDGIADEIDNCVSVVNPEQTDVDGNDRGDDCDDFDKDGVVNSKDNCIDYPNRNQADVDADGIGDVCDKEESRVTEKYTWLPWAGMGLAAVVILILFISTIKGMLKKPEEEVSTAERDDNVSETE